MKKDECGNIFNLSVEIQWWRTLNERAKTRKTKKKKRKEKKRKEKKKAEERGSWKKLNMEACAVNIQ